MSLSIFFQNGSPWVCSWLPWKISFVTCFSEIYKAQSVTGYIYNFRIRLKVAEIAWFDSIDTKSSFFSQYRIISKLLSRNNALHTFNSELACGLQIDLAKAILKSTLISSGYLHQTACKPIHWPCTYENSNIFSLLLQFQD